MGHAPLRKSRSSLSLFGGHAKRYHKRTATNTVDGNPIASTTNPSGE